MSPLMMRFFALVGIALAAASMMKARADPVGEPEVQQVRIATAAQLKAFAGSDWRTT